MPNMFYFFISNYFHCNFGPNCFGGPCLFLSFCSDILFVLVFVFNKRTFAFDKIWWEFSYGFFGRWRGKVNVPPPGHPPSVCRPMVSSSVFALGFYTTHSTCHFRDPWPPSHLTALCLLGSRSGGYIMIR